jgi:hypothetical protein
MESLKLYLINEAFKKSESIKPVGNVKSLHECFTVNDDCLLFWYNDNSGSTRMVSCNI